MRSKDVFFTSDTHYYHKNILKYCNRPFDSIGKCNKAMIDRWNSVCDGNSIVYHLGDVLLGSPGNFNKIFPKLKFKEMHIIKGNHDKPLAKWGKKYWQEAHSHNLFIYDTYHELTVNHKGKEHHIVACHYPLARWNRQNYGSIHVHGHCHGNHPEHGWMRYCDVGVDSNNFTPVSFTQLLERMDKKEGPKPK